MSLLSTPQPPAPVAARTVQPMGEDMPGPKKRLNADGSTPKKRGPKPGFKRRKRRGGRPFAKLADKVAKTKARSPAVDLAQATFATLEQVLDLDGCAPVVHSAWKAHKAALELLAG